MKNTRQTDGAPAPRPGDPVARPGYQLVEQRRVLGGVVRAVWRTPEGDELEWWITVGSLCFLVSSCLLIPEALAAGTGKAGRST